MAALCPRFCYKLLWTEFLALDKWWRVSGSVASGILSLLFTDDVVLLASSNSDIQLALGWSGRIGRSQRRLAAQVREVKDLRVLFRIDGKIELDIDILGQCQQ